MIPSNERKVPAASASSSALPRIVLVCWLSFVWAEAAEAITGDTLMAMCRDERAFVQGECWGFIHGVMSTMNALENHERVNFAACLPNQLGYIEGKRMVINFLEDNPLIRHVDAPTLVMRAVTHAFPCE